MFFRFVFCIDFCLLSGLILVRFWRPFGSPMVVQIGHFGHRFVDDFCMSFHVCAPVHACACLCVCVCVCVAPGPPQDGPRAPKSGPRAAKSGPRAAKSGPRAAQERPKAANERQRVVNICFLMFLKMPFPLSPPKRLAKCFKTALRAARDQHKTLKIAKVAEIDKALPQIADEKKAGGRR